MAGGDPIAEDRILRVGELAHPALETAYRQKYAPQDRLFGRVIVGGSAAATVGLAGMDHSFHPDGSTLAWLWGVRLSFLAVSLAALYALRGRPTPDRFVRVFGGWNYLTVGLHLAGGVLMPAGHTDVRLTATISVLMTYIVTPLPLRHLVAASALHTAASLLISVWLNPGDDGTAVISQLCWLGMTNVLGVIAAYRLHTRQRRMFASALRQAELSANLGRALAEVKTLRGLIRVCSWCRKVDSEGVWQQMECYVREHSHAEFTHGICPPCLEATCRELAEQKE